MELRNPLTNYKLDILRPLPLVTEFDWNDVVGGSLLIGKCIAEHLIEKTTIEITTPFNNGFQVTVGDIVAQGRLQTATDNTAEISGSYEVVNNYSYPIDTNIFLFFPGGIPTIGNGRVIVYFG